MKKILSVILILFTVTSCKKDVLEADPNYEGDWTTTGDCREFLYINPDGSGKYTKQYYNDCGKGDETSTDDKITVGKKYIKIGRRKFRVITPPAFTDTILIGDPYGIHKAYYYLELEKTWMYNKDLLKFYRLESN